MDFQIASIPLASFLDFLHRSNDESLGIFNLLHYQPHIHCRELWLALTSAIDSMLADQSQRIRQDVQGGRQASTDRSHLEFVSFFRITVMV